MGDSKQRVYLHNSTKTEIRVCSSEQDRRDTHELPSQLHMKNNQTCAPVLLLMTFRLPLFLTKRICCDFMTGPHEIISASQVRLH